jgi:hypothetical protein
VEVELVLQLDGVASHTCCVTAAGLEIGLRVPTTCHVGYKQGIPHGNIPTIPRALAHHSGALVSSPTPRIARQITIVALISMRQ